MKHLEARHFTLVVRMSLQREKEDLTIIFYKSEHEVVDHAGSVYSSFTTFN